ncbi:MAG: hypothetical protein PHW89_07930 [Sulfurimonas denitrificans]|nr:hypothetical protein [Sulfurimonas denitrificans]
MTNLADKQEIINFQDELNKLLKKYDCYLYAEDEYGRELLDIKAFRSMVFDLQLFNEDGSVRELFKYKRGTNL